MWVWQQSIRVKEGMPGAAEISGKSPKVNLLCSHYHPAAEDLGSTTSRSRSRLQTQDAKSSRQRWGRWSRRVSPSPGSGSPTSQALAGALALPHLPPGCPHPQRGGMREEGRPGPSHSASQSITYSVDFSMPGPFLHPTHNKAKGRKQNFSGKCEVPQSSLLTVHHKIIGWDGQLGLWQARLVVRGRRRNGGRQSPW